jgi:hypothetical protein
VTWKVDPINNMAMGRSTKTTKGNLTRIKKLAKVPIYLEKVLAKRHSRGKEIYESKAFLPRAGVDAADLAGAVLGQEHRDRLRERVGRSRERLRRVAE